MFTYLKDEYIDTTGGWHDAGDYGKYGVIEDKVIADLLFSYLYGDNKDEKLVDEIKFGLNYILKLQKKDGSVYNKVTSKNFANFISPAVVSIYSSFRYVNTLLGLVWQAG